MQSKMATMECLTIDAPPHNSSSNGHTILTADPDLAAAAAAVSLPQDDDKDSGVLSEPEELRRISKRTRMRRSLNFSEKQTAADLLQSDGKESAISSATSDDRKKQRSLWTRPETQAFFDALAEHGKDFQAIQTFIQNKLSPDSSKKNKSSASASSGGSGNKTIPIHVSSTSLVSSPVLSNLPHASSGIIVPVNEVKSREQVRHFYYRTWHKISGSCQFGDVINSQASSETVSEESPEKIQETLKDIDKGVLELYGLINYGEIWKKFPSKWDSRIKTHLKELVLEGCTVIKLGPKAKAIKIKTPICKALKKLNSHGAECDVSPGSDSLIQQLPDEVIVQLVPEDCESFLKVQSVAQNPRLQCRICPQRKISSLAFFLEHYKWDSSRHRKFLCPDLSDCTFDELLPELRGNIKLSLHRSHHQSLDLLGAGLTLSQSSTCIQLPDQMLAQASSFSHQCLNLGLSFRSYLRNTQRLSKAMSKSVQKSSRKEKTPTTSFSVAPAAASRDFVDETSPEKDTTKSIAIEIEDSCSSTSSITPFRDTVKKLAILNQALNSEVEDSATSSGELKLKSTADPVFSDPADQNADESEVVSSSIRDDSEVSLPPPTATLAQWLNSRDDHCPDLLDSDPTNEDHVPDYVDKVCDSDKIALDIESIRDGWTSNDTSITFAELYLLLKSPAKVILTYSFVESGLSTKEMNNESQERHFRSIASDDQPSKHASLMDKLLTAASISLSLYRKTQAPTASSCLPFAAPLTSNTSPGASIHQSNCSIRTSASTTNRSPTNVYKKQTQQMSSVQHTLLPVAAAALAPVTAAARPGQSLVTDPMPILSHHNFLIPTGPAPKAVIHPSSSGNTGNPCQSVNSVTADNHSGIANNNISGSRNGASSSNNNNKRTRIICEDPQVLEDAIKQLNQNRFMPKKKRQRVIRPITVGPVSSKLLLPRQTLQMIPAATSPASHIQILSAPSAVSVPATDNAGSAATANTLSLPIMLHPNAVPTILIPTAMIAAANLNAPAPAPAAAGVESGLYNVCPSESTPSVTTLAPVTPAIDSVTHMSLGHSESSSLHPGQRDDRPDSNANKSASNADTLCGSGSSDLPGLGQNSNSSLPCLSSLLELSLPDPTTPVTSNSSISHSFFNDNSCSSISEFISFGNPNMGQAALPATQAACSSLTGSNGRDGGSKTGQTPNWLLSEGSNSSSLGLSSLIFNGNELI